MPDEDVNEPLLDFTQQYNTPLPAKQQAAYEAWARQNGQDPVKGRYDYDLQGAFAADSGKSGSGHFTDQFKKPNHPTFSDESQYHGVDGYEGGKWTDAGYQPSVTNLTFRTPAQLQQYFQQVEPDTKLLLPPDYAMPVPKPALPPALQSPGLLSAPGKSVLQRKGLLQ
jgi:hypothetical protein